MGKLAELVHVLEDLAIDLLLIQESWLDMSVQNPVIPNFYVVGRRDRKDGPNCGGVITYARKTLSNISHYKSSDDCERMWHLLLRDSGCIAICNWYLPPGATLEEIESLNSELAEVTQVAHTCVLTGDLNVHHRSWLRFSREDTTRGRHLKEICDNYGHRQLISQSIRGEYLLDPSLSPPPWMSRLH